MLDLRSPLMRFRHRPIPPSRPRWQNESQGIPESRHIKAVRDRRGVTILAWHPFARQKPFRFGPGTRQSGLGATIFTAAL
jgi:hypothetical protein